MSTISSDDENESTTKQLDDVSRDPSDYAAADHLLIRYHRGAGPTSETRTNPPITGDVIRQCIEGGEIKEAHDGCIIYSELVDGIDWWLIANPDTREVLTAYAPEYHEHTLSEVTDQ